MGKSLDSLRSMLSGMIRDQEKRKKEKDAFNRNMLSRKMRLEEDQFKSSLRSKKKAENNALIQRGIKLTGEASRRHDAQAVIDNRMTDKEYGARWGSAPASKKKGAAGESPNLRGEFIKRVSSGKDMWEDFGGNAPTLEDYQGKYGAPAESKQPARQGWQGWNTGGPTATRRADGTIVFSDTPQDGTMLDYNQEAGKMAEVNTAKRNIRQKVGAAEQFNQDFHGPLRPGESPVNVPALRQKLTDDFNKRFTQGAETPTVQPTRNNPTGTQAVTGDNYQADGQKTFIEKEQDSMLAPENMRDPTGSRKHSHLNIEEGGSIWGRDENGQTQRLMEKPDRFKREYGKMVPNPEWDQYIQFVASIDPKAAEALMAEEEDPKEFKPFSRKEWREKRRQETASRKAKRRDERIRSRNA